MNLPDIAMSFLATENRVTMDTILKVAPLIPALVAGSFKLLEDHGRQRHKASLIESIARLAKNIADLPELPTSGRSSTERLRAAFEIELDRCCEELTALQKRAPRRTVGLSSISAGLRSALLLYRPRGAAAWMLHLGFYACLLIFAFMTLGYFASDPNGPGTTTGVVITIYTIMGIPPLVLRYFAMRIHRRQCASSEAAHAGVVAVA